MRVRELGGGGMAEGLLPRTAYSAGASPRSSGDQSDGLLSRGSQVRILPRALEQDVCRDWLLGGHPPVAGLTVDRSTPGGSGTRRADARVDYFGGFGGRPRRNGPYSAPQASIAVASQTGPDANRASGLGKSRRFAYWTADRLLTPRISATSARPARRLEPIARKRMAETGGTAGLLLR